MDTTSVPLVSTSSVPTLHTPHTSYVGFASQLARPLFRERQHDDMSEEEAMELIHDALKVQHD